MSAMLWLRIGNTRLALETGRLTPGMLDDLWRRYAAFVDADVPPTQALTQALTHGGDAFRIAVCVRRGPAFLPWQANAPLPLRTRRIGRCVVCITPGEAGYFDLVARRGRVTLRTAGNVENYLRVLVGWDAALRGGLLLHASGVVRERGAYLFFGPSGAGKSTVAHLSVKWPVLSDDLVLVEHDVTGYVAYGVPFRGNEWSAPRLNSRARLAGLLALEQAPRNACLPLDRGAGVARLVAATPFVTTCPVGATTVLGSALALTATTPVARLQFRKDESFWEVLHG